MPIRRREVRLLEQVPIIAASQVARSQQVILDDADVCRLLLKVTEIGSPAVGDTLVVRPVFVDDDGVEYLDANTTYGTFTLTGNDTPVNVTVVIPVPARTMSLLVTGAGSLSASTGFIVSARLVLTANTSG